MPGPVASVVDKITGALKGKAGAAAPAEVRGGPGREGFGIGCQDRPVVWQTGRKNHSPVDLTEVQQASVAGEVWQEKCGRRTVG